jgi:aminoglycoside N3'-acetyltransferase
MININQLERDLRAMGLTEGDVVFLRISYRALGRVEGGPNTFIDALLHVIGDNGAIIATAFPHLHLSPFRLFYKKQYFSGKKDIVPSTGAIPTVMVKRNDSFISCNPSYPFVIIGNVLKSIVQSQSLNNNLYAILEIAANKYNAKCLRIGGDVTDGTTHIALTESLKLNNLSMRRASYGYYYLNSSGGKQWYNNMSSYFCLLGFKDFFNGYIKNEATLKEGQIGDGYAIVTSMRKTLLIEKNYFLKDPLSWRCHDRDCLICNLYYAWSFKRAFVYIIRFVKEFCINHDYSKIRQLRSLILVFLFGKKVV